MFSKKLYGYSISLRRGLPECEHESSLGRKFYVHREDLTDFVFQGTGKRRIHLIFDEIKSKQPTGLSDDELKRYFDKEMKRRGFREIDFPGITGVTSNYSYLYSAR